MHVRINDIVINPTNTKNEQKIEGIISLIYILEFSL